MTEMSKQKRSRKPDRQTSRLDWCREATGGVLRNKGEQQNPEESRLP